MQKGFLVSFEGGEACGKSTQIKLLAKALEEQGRDFLLVREPGGTELGEKVRAILLQSKGEISSQTEFLLFSASRSKLIADVVHPALDEGKLVIMDRFFDSSFAYQGYAGNLNISDIDLITKFATGGLVPDLTFLLDITYEDGLKRKAADENLKNLDRIESKGKKYHDAVRAGYLKIANDNKERVVVLSATQSPEQIHNQIITELEARLAKKGVKE